MSGNNLLCDPCSSMYTCKYIPIKSHVESFKLRWEGVEEEDMDFLKGMYCPSSPTQIMSWEFLKDNYQNGNCVMCNYIYKRCQTISAEYSAEFSTEMDNTWLMPVMDFSCIHAAREFSTSFVFGKKMTSDGTLDKFKYESYLNMSTVRAQSKYQFHPSNIKAGEEKLTFTQNPVS